MTDCLTFAARSTTREPAGYAQQTTDTAALCVIQALYTQPMELSVSQHDADAVRFSLLRYDGRATDEEMIAALAMSQEILVASLRDHKKNLTIIELARTFSMAASQRRLQSDWNREYRELWATSSVGIAFIADSAVTRGIFTAVFWIAPPPIPRSVCASLDEALEWSFELCQSRGFELTKKGRADCKAKLTLRTSEQLGARPDRAV